MRSVIAAGAPRPSDRLLELVAANRGGRPLGLTSVCSANRFVLETVLQHASDRHGLVCIESTSNQVNQSGGYTGMTAAAFRDEVAALAAAAGVPAARLLLGGDHLGPYPWRSLPARRRWRTRTSSCAAACWPATPRSISTPACAAPTTTAMRRRPLDDDVIVERTVALCRTAEAARAELPAARPPPST